MQKSALQVQVLSLLHRHLLLYCNRIAGYTHHIRQVVTVPKLQCFRLYSGFSQRIGGELNAAPHLAYLTSFPASIPKWVKSPFLLQTFPQTCLADTETSKKNVTSGGELSIVTIIDELSGGKT